MSLPVPLSVRVGNRRITEEVQSLAFRKEAVGGLRSISFSLTRPLSDLSGLDPLAKVYVDDGRNATTIAQGRLADTGRSVDGGSNQKWDCVAFGPVQHASDVTAPLIYVSRMIDGDAWRQVEVVHQEATFGVASAPGDFTVAPTQGLLAQFPNDLALTGGGFSRLILLNTTLAATGQKLARVRFNWDTGITNPDFEVLLVTGTAGSVTTIFAVAANTAGGTVTSVVNSQFPNGQDSARLYFHKAVNNNTVVGDTTWAFFFNVVIRAMQYNPDGTEITTGYVADSVTATEVVNDLLGRRLTEYDGANATVAVTSNPLFQLAYPAGVTAEQVFADLMAVEPAYRWTTTPDTRGNGYGFSWEPWSTTVRYEATLDDGGSFPISTQGLYNKVCVKWVAPGGYQQNTYRTKACALLDNADILRQATIDLGSEIGSDTAAIAAGDAFLQDHNVPKNAGTLTVARPIRDVITGMLVQPWEIEEGELVRINGVEAYPDAFNSSTNDGQGVFRIHAIDYTTDGNSASLSLDSDPRSTTDALVQLLNQRARP